MTIRLVQTEKLTEVLESSWTIITQLLFLVCSDVLKKFKLAIIFMKFLLDVKKAIFNVLLKFYVEMPIEDQPTADQTFENFHFKIRVAMLVGN